MSSIKNKCAFNVSTFKRFQFKLSICLCSDLDRPGTPSENAASVAASAMELEPESVHVALRGFVQNMVKAERERDDALLQNRTLEGRVRDSELERQRADERGHQLQKALGDSEDERRQLEARLGAAQSALVGQEDTLKRNERDRKALQEQVALLERSLASTDAERKAVVVCLMSTLYKSIQVYV